MQFKVFSLLAVGATATLAAATGSSPSNQCNTGAAQCCNSTADAKQPVVSSLLGLLGVVVQDITGQIGVNCSPITVVGVAGNSWCVHFVVSRKMLLTDGYVARSRPCAVRTTASVSVVPGSSVFWSFILSFRWCRRDWLHSHQHQPLNALPPRAAPAPAIVYEKDVGMGATFGTRGVRVISYLSGFGETLFYYNC